MQENEQEFFVLAFRQFHWDTLYNLYVCEKDPTTLTITNIVLDFPD